MEFKKQIYGTTKLECTCTMGRLLLCKIYIFAKEQKLTVFCTLTQYKSQVCQVFKY